MLRESIPIYPFLDLAVIDNEANCSYEPFIPSYISVKYACGRFLLFTPPPSVAENAKNPRNVWLVYNPSLSLTMLRLAILTVSKSSECIIDDNNYKINRSHLDVFILVILCSLFLKCSSVLNIIIIVPLNSFIFMVYTYMRNYSQ